jgi:hypothetical protein
MEGTGSDGRGVFDNGHFELVRARYVEVKLATPSESLG